VRARSAQVGAVCGTCFAPTSCVIRAVVVLLFIFARTARADEARSSSDVEDEDREVHVLAITLEAAIVLAVPTAYYWNTKEHQAVDWTLDWDLESWKAKLLSTEKLKFDTNPFHYNALRHPLVGILDYQIGRTNGLGVIGSMVFAYANEVLWEFLIEFREAPSVNDMITNGAGGIAIGEPLYQIGQLWRVEKPSLADRAHTALVSPWDALHDTYRKSRTPRFRAWRSIVLGAGSATRWFGDDLDHELSLDADFDVIAHRAFVTRGEHSGPIAAGAWSRLHVSAGISSADESPFSRTSLDSRTVFAGSYSQSAAGTGQLAAIGTGFTYRYDRLDEDRDRLAMFHIAGPQVQLTLRRPDRAVWIDLAMYGDFALVDPIAFGPENTLPRPPPYFSSMQSDGYYYAAGFSTVARVRAARGPWNLDVELAAHRFWQIDEHTLHNAELADGRPISDLTITNQEDWRFFGRAKLGYRPSRWGIAATLDGAYRRGTWREHARDANDLAAGLVLELDY
jgi:hypothetical protein